MVSARQSTDYIYATERADSRRVTVLESTYDGATIERMRRIGVRRGWRCLEVGAGGGSIARWLVDQVGPDGHVTAVDLDISALTGDEAANLDAVALDLRTDQLPRGDFDLVHTRLVLGHIVEREQVLQKLVAALRPGGHLFLEEADDLAATALEPDLHGEVMAAAMAAFESAGFDFRWGRAMPRRLRELGLVNVVVDCDVPISEGGSAGMEWLRLSFDQVNTGPFAIDVPPHRYEEWRRMVSRAGRWFVGLATVGAWAEIPG